MSVKCDRLHVVLIPGFAGFEALGQLEYFAGVTPVFRRWTERHGRQGVALHYSASLPTAAVAKRAARLQRYLAERIVRGVIGPRDCVVLAGHSTGGLDIRRLLADLARRPETRFEVDGGNTVEAREVLDRVCGIVFLSVPQWGTNLADWLQAHELGRSLVVTELRAAAVGSQFPVLDRIVTRAAGAAAYLSGSDFLRAVEDTLREADVGSCKSDPTRAAEAYHAASKLELYLRFMASDFSVIPDLTAAASGGSFRSPAHFTAEMRREELSVWSRHQIRIRSYATLGRRPFSFPSGSPAPLSSPFHPRTLRELTEENTLAAGTDIVYRFFYRACAGGPLCLPVPSADWMPRLLGSSSVLGGNGRIELWDNDGFVNTASMLWPDEGDTVLVAADHMDIVGHYRLAAAAPGSGRKYRTYDLLGSDSGFGAREFEELWWSVFDFCAGQACAGG